MFRLLIQRNEMINFDFSGKGLGLVPSPHFMHDFSRKMCFMLYSIDQTSFSDCLYFLRYWAIYVL